MKLNHTQDDEILRWHWT